MHEEITDIIYILKYYNLSYALKQHEVGSVHVRYGRYIGTSIIENNIDCICWEMSLLDNLVESFSELLLLTKCNSEYYLL